jgi:AcrR family transcriptional regulator
MPAEPRRRAAAKQETRDALIAAALAEFAERGLDAPSLDAICARAGYTRGAFYVHFRDRADLMVAVVEHALGSFLDAVLARGDEAHDLEHTIDRFADAVARTLAGASGGATVLPLPASVPFARVLEGVMRSAALRERFAALLGVARSRLAGIAAQAQRAGTLRADVAPEQVAFLLITIALGVVVGLDVGLPMDPPAARATVQALLVRAPAVER